jgi:hypothetical protein
MKQWGLGSLPIGRKKMIPGQGARVHLLYGVEETNDDNVKTQNNFEEVASYIDRC